MRSLTVCGTLFFLLLMPIWVESREIKDQQNIDRWLGEKIEEEYCYIQSVNGVSTPHCRKGNSYDQENLLDGFLGVLEKTNIKMGPLSFSLGRLNRFEKQKIGGSVTSRIWSVGGVGVRLKGSGLVNVKEHPNFSIFFNIEILL